MSKNFLHDIQASGSQYAAAKLGNEIPLQIRNSSTVFEFKRKLKRTCYTNNSPNAQNLGRAASIYFLNAYNSIPCIRYIVAMGFNIFNIPYYIFTICYTLYAVL